MNIAINAAVQATVALTPPTTPPSSRDILSNPPSRPTRVTVHKNTPAISLPPMSFRLGEEIQAEVYHCLACGENMGEHNPRQFCGKTYCRNGATLPRTPMYLSLDCSRNTNDIGDIGDGNNSNNKNDETAESIYIGDESESERSEDEEPSDSDLEFVEGVCRVAYVRDLKRRRITSSIMDLVHQNI